MRLFALIQAPDDKGGEIRALVETSMPDEPLEVHDTVGGLTERLSRLSDESAPVVVLAPSKAGLLQLAEYRAVLGRLHTILLLPDDDEGTVTQAHDLRPRVVLQNCDGPAELPAILEAMLRHLGATADSLPEERTAKP